MAGQHWSFTRPEGEADNKPPLYFDRESQEAINLASLRLCLGKIHALRRALPMLV